MKRYVVVEWYRDSLNQGHDNLIPMVARSFDKLESAQDALKTMVKEESDRTVWKWGIYAFAEGVEMMPRELRLVTAPGPDRRDDKPDE